MPFKKIALFYGHMASNIGDLAINQGEAALLKQVFPEAALHVVVFGPAKHDLAFAARSSFSEHVNVSFSHFVAEDRKAVDYQNYPYLFLKDCGAGDADLIALASGEHFFRYAKEENTRNLFWRMLPLFSAKASDKACVVLPSTFGPFEEDDSSNAVSSLVSLADTLAVRDRLSAKLLKTEIGCPSPPELLDPAFFISPLPPVSRSGVAESRAADVLGLIMRSEGWGIRLSAHERKEQTASFQEDGYRSSRAYRFSTALCQAYLSRQGTRVRLFVQTEADRALATRVRHALAELGYEKRIELYRPTSVDDYVEQLARVDHVVASRFHAIILALAVGRPVFGVYFDAHGHKMPGLFDLLGLQQNCINLSVAEPEKAAAAVSDVLPGLRGQQSNTQQEIEKLRQQTVAWLAGIAMKSVDSRSIVDAFTSLDALTSTLVPGGRNHGTRQEKMIRRADLENQAEARIASLEQQLSEAHSQIASLAAELSAARQTRLFKLRTALVSGFQTIRAVVRQPRKYAVLGWKAWQERSVHQFVKIYRRNGIDAVVAAVAAADRTEPERQARKLVRIIKALLNAGHPEAELPLARKALSLDRSEPVLAAFFEAAQRNKRFEEASDIILELERLFGPAPTNEQAKLLEKLRASPIYLLTVLKSIGPQQPLAYQPASRRICYVLHNSLPYSSGGYAIRSQGVAEGLRNAGYEVVALTRPGFPVDTVPTLRAENVPPFEAVGGVTYVRTLDPLRNKLSSRDYILYAADAIEAQIREFRPEIVVAASAYLSGLPTLIAARRLGVPFAYEVRGFWEITRVSRSNDMLKNPQFETERILETAVANHAVQVFTLTEGMRDELVQRGVPEAKIALFPNSCDPEKFAPRPRDPELAQLLRIPEHVPVIGYAGTFVDYEGLEDLAKACGLLKERGVEFRLLLVGNENPSGESSGSIAKRIDVIARKSGFSDWLIMPGRVPHDDVGRYYSLMDICPFPRKPLQVCELVSPMKPLEALAMEKAVVVSSVRALSEMIRDGETGLVFRKGDVKDLADVLERLIKDGLLRKRLGMAGRQWVQESRTWSSTAGSAAEYLSMLSGADADRAMRSSA